MVFIQKSGEFHFSGSTKKTKVLVWEEKIQATHISPTLHEPDSSPLIF